MTTGITMAIKRVRKNNKETNLGLMRRNHSFPYYPFWGTLPKEEEMQLGQTQALTQTDTITDTSMHQTLVCYCSFSFGVCPFYNLSGLSELHTLPIQKGVLKICEFISCINVISPCIISFSFSFSFQFILHFGG